MGKLIDLTGQRFGRLTVIERGEDYVTPYNYVTGDTYREVRWKCQCDCGNVVEVTSKALRYGNTKSCGCLRREVSSKQAKEMAKKSEKLQRENC